MQTEDNIAELKKIIGVKDFNNLSPNDVERILKLIGEQRLKEGQIKALLEIAPTFLKLATESLKTISNIADGAKDSQSDAMAAIIAAINGIAETLNILARSAETDYTREKIALLLIEAGKIYIELAKLSKEMNEDNNKVWKVLGMGALLALGAVLTALASNGRNSNDSNQT